MAKRYRVRRLSTREYGRLMGVKDEDIDLMMQTCSSSQLYRQFGNSIVVDVLMAIYKNLNIQKVENDDNRRNSKET